MTDYVILVDEQDREIGVMEKMAAHRQGALHRAFSLFVFNRDKKLLLHQRAGSKYHSPNLWTNTCCSHPRPGEKLESSAHRRLMEEMGFDCGLKEIFAFRYTAELDQGLIENEYDHVFIGEFNGEPKPDPNEAADYTWAGLKELAVEVGRHPERFSYWFKAAFDRVGSHVSVMNVAIGDWFGR